MVPGIRPCKKREFTRSLNIRQSSIFRYTPKLCSLVRRGRFIENSGEIASFPETWQQRFRRQSDDLPTRLRCTLLQVQADQDARRLGRESFLRPECRRSLA